MRLNVKDIVETLSNQAESLPSREDIVRALNLGPRRGASEEIMGAIGVFTVGVLLGAGLALLLAPQTGAQTRQSIGERVNDLRASLGTGSEREQYAGTSAQAS